MSARLALVRASGGVSLGTRVGGISLALRHIRMAARNGFAGVQFVAADPAVRQAVQAIIDRSPRPDGLTVSVSAEPEPELGAEIVELEGSALYTADSLRTANAPVPAFRITGKQDLRKAERFLFSQIRKSVALDGVISYYVMRPLARLLTHVLLNTRISPNQVTLGALFCGLTAAMLAAMGGGRNAVFAGLLYWLGGIIDHVDGELARLRLQSSKAGEWLDSMTDETSTFSLLAGLGIGLAHDGYSDFWLWLGVCGSLAGALAVGRLYLDLHRMGLPIDTAQFPWFFNKPDATDSASARSRVLDTLGFVLRRDANVTVVSILVFLNYRTIAACTIGAAAAIGVVLVTTHYSVVAYRSRAG